MEQRNRKNRISPEELAEQIMSYDVISFDIFDTAIFRKVDMPNDVFSIMAMENGYGDYIQVRKTAENVAREREEDAEGTREVSLAEIYEVLAEDYGIDRTLMEREIALEMALTEANPYIYRLYRRLREYKKTVIFISDMYLPQSVMERILQENGYTEYEKLYLSNRYKLRKGDGGLQRAVLAENPGKKIIHIGDAQNGDVDQSRLAGMDALFYEDAREVKPEKRTENLSGSLYRAVINNGMYNGTWDKNIYYSHGFLVGGILAAGYCEYINRVARERKIDKILFCARDCEIIWKIYNSFYKEYENEYIGISRYAVMSISLERYLYDWAERFIFRYVGPDSPNSKTDKTVAQVLQEAGTDYLIGYLEEAGLEQNMPAGQIKRGRMKRFVFSHADVIREHNRENVRAAECYYKNAIGSAKRVLVADIGWSGTCITALKYFVEAHLSETACEVSGTLMCTTRGKTLTAYMEEGILSSYIYSPYHNMDLLSFMIDDELPDEELDYRHLSLEYLFTSAAGTLIQYGLDKDGAVTFERSVTKPENVSEIQEMQEGMFCFVEKYQKYSKAGGKNLMISPYVAFGPLLKACGDREYTRNVYRNFPHDSSWLPYQRETERKTFGECFTE